jgi:competence protein ComEA
MKQILNVALGVMAGFVLAGVVFLVARLPEGKSITLEPAPTKAPITVQVMGAVVHPGVYTFADGGRVQDAIAAAGGLLAEANANQVNLVAKLEDGKQVNIPYLPGMEPKVAAPAPTAAALFQVMVTPTATGSAANLIDINSATADELATLPGIGPTLAQRIIDYRDQNGGFSSTDELLNVPGIGDAIYNRIKDLIVAN